MSDIKGVKKDCADEILNKTKGHVKKVFLKILKFKFIKEEKNMILLLVYFNN